jgi:cell division transport system permease protein
MTFDARTAAPIEIERPGPLLPKEGRQDRALGLVIAVLCALACLAVIVALAADRATSDWTQALGASATVQVRPRAGQTPSEAADKAAEALAGVKGVAEARALDRAAAEKLIEPWFGPGGVPEDLPLPRLVTVDLDPKAPPTAAQLNQALTAAGVDAALDDHSRWMADVKRAGGLVRGVAALAVLVFGLAAGALVVFATRATLEARREVVEVLHLAGAEDRFLSGLVQRRFAWLAGQAGLIGAASAAGLAALAKAAGGADGLTPVLPLAWSDLLAVVPAPLLCAGLAAVAVRRTAMSILRSETF